MVPEETARVVETEMRGDARGDCSVAREFSVAVEEDEDDDDDDEEEDDAGCF